MRLLKDKCDIYAFGFEFSFDRDIFGEYWIGIRIGKRCFGVAW